MGEDMDDPNNDKIIVSKIALKNIFMHATRQKRKAVGDDQIMAWDYILKFCRECGCELTGIIRANTSI
jgi:hypothetical protein